MSDNPDPKEALASIQAAREQVGRTLNYPLWWDFVGGLPVVAIVAGQGLPDPWPLLVLVFAMLGLVLLMKVWRDQFGWWVNGYSPRRARWVAIGMVAVMMPLLGLGLWTRYGDGAWWLPLVGGGIAWVIMAIGGRLWMHVYRKELAERGA